MRDPACCIQGRAGEGWSLMPRSPPRAANRWVARRRRWTTAPGCSGPVGWWPLPKTRPGRPISRPWQRKTCRRRSRTRPIRSRGSCRPGEGSCRDTTPRSLFQRPDHRCRAGAGRRRRGCGRVRLALTVEGNAQDQPIVDAVAAALLAWEARAAAAAQVEDAEREVARGWCC